MAAVDNTEVKSVSLDDHPKIMSNLKDHLHSFNSKGLKPVELQHKVSLPTAEGLYRINNYYINVIYFFVHAIFYIFYIIILIN